MSRLLSRRVEAAAVWRTVRIVGRFMVIDGTLPFSKACFLRMDNMVGGLLFQLV